MNKCPRCNLPQKGIYKCQYCGYDLNKYNRRFTKTILPKLKDIISGFKKVQIISNNKRSRAHSMNKAVKTFKSTDIGGKRSGTDRRKQRYATYFPERRSGRDRRK